MKKATAILLTAVLMMSFLTGCAGKRYLYKNVNLGDYIEVGDYLKIEIDKSDDGFMQYYNEQLDADADEKDLYEKLTEGVVVDGYIANIDYEGKIDDVAFDGGTSQGYKLKIGSNTFIDDFEEQLIGVAVGETKIVTVTFPTTYQNSPDLAGKEAVFTVKVNYIGRPLTVEEAYSTMGFDSADDYDTDITKRAAKEYIFDKICAEAKINDYPEKELERLGEAIYEHSSDYYKTYYNQEFETLLNYNNISVDDYKKDAATEFMSINMIMYYILDAENLEIYESTVESQGVDQPLIAESYAVQEIVIEYLYDNAVIK